MPINPALRAMVAAASAKYPTVPSSADLPVPHLVACLAELGLQRATKRELLRVIETALQREAAE